MAGNYNLDDIFSLEDVDENQVVIKVHTDSPLKVAQFPFISGEMAYITVTRGPENNLMKVVNKDGSSSNYSWNRYYVDPDKDWMLLKHQVEKFIKDCNILLDWAEGTPTKATIYYNSSFHQWQLSINSGKAVYRSDTARSLEEMKEDCRRFVEAEDWIEAIAETKITVWNAVEPKFVFS